MAGGGVGRVATSFGKQGVSPWVAWPAMAALLLPLHAAGGLGESPADAATASGSPRAAELAAGCSQRERQVDIVRDFSLRRSWIVYQHCAHPEMPRIAVLSEQPWGAETTAVQADVRLDPRRSTLAERPSSRLALQPLVLAGSRVRLWRVGPTAHIELAGTALDSGALGGTVRIRIIGEGAVLGGIVRGRNSVELQTSAGSGFIQGKP